MTNPIKPTTPRGLTMVPTWQRATFLEPSWQRLVREGYGKNAAVANCIQRLALAYQQPRPVVVRETDGERLDKHPLQTLLNRPNPLMSWSELALFIATYKAIGGNAYLWKQRPSPKAPPVALWPFHAGNITVIPGETEWIAGYVYNPGNDQTVLLASSEIVHLKWPTVDPDQPWQALPPLRAVAREVDTDNEATRYVYSLLFNDATPRTTVRIPADAGSLSQPEYDRLKAQFRLRFGGEARGDVAILEGGAELERMALDMDELAFDTLRKVPEARIASAFMIPVEYSGLNVGLEHSTYNNVSEARAGFFEDTIIPMCALDAAELTQDLGPEFGDGIRIEHDTSMVVALQENQDARYTRVINGYGQGLLGHREARRLLGLPEEVAPDDMTIAGPVAVDGEIAAQKSVPILGYHIEAGVVSKNEARAQLGLQPEDATQDEKLRTILSLLTVTQAAVNVGIPLETALSMVGLRVELPPPPPPPVLIAAPVEEEEEDEEKEPPEAELPKAHPITVKAKGPSMPSMRAIERRMEKALIPYFEAQYERAAQGVA